MSEHTLTIVIPARDLRQREIAKRLSAIPETKAKVSRFFLNAMTMNVDQVKRYEADLFSDDFEIIGTQDKARLKNQFNLNVWRFVPKGYTLLSWGALRCDFGKRR